MLARLSLTHRLTVFFTLVAASVVLALGWFFMSEVERHFAKLDSAALMDKKHLIEEVMANANSAEDMRWRLDEALGHHQGLFAAVSDRQGATVFKTQGFEVPELANLQAADPETPVQQVFQRFSGSLQKILEDIDRRVGCDGGHRAAVDWRGQHFACCSHAGASLHATGCLFVPASPAAPHCCCFALAPVQAAGEPGEPHRADQPGAPLVLLGG